MKMLKFLRVRKSKGRIYKEKKQINDFQYDVAKVIYSSNFRKLEYKTQVFFNNANDYYRTRLTHTLEVAQIAKMITSILGLNQDLTEVISLSHDLGHTPFGHAGEDGLNEVLQEFGYPEFSHNVQSVRVVDFLSKRYSDFDGLNLTFEAIDGLIKHNGPIKHSKSHYLDKVARKYNINLQQESSLEAQISSISDDIAYMNHDIEDGYRSKLLSFDDIVSLPIIGEFVKKEYDSRPNDSKKMILYEGINNSIQFMIDDVVQNIYKNVKKHKIESLEDFRAVNKNFANFSSEILEKRMALKEVVFSSLYKSSELSIISFKMRNVIKDLFRFYMNNEICLPNDWKEKIRDCGDKKYLVICDFIAGMTDRYALHLHKEIFY